MGASGSSGILLDRSNQREALLFCFFQFTAFWRKYLTTLLLWFQKFNYSILTTLGVVASGECQAGVKIS
jgi:hypothetical protein